MPEIPLELVPSAGDKSTTDSAEPNDPMIPRPRIAISTFFINCILAFQRFLITCDDVQSTESPNNSNGANETGVSGQATLEQLVVGLDSFRAWAGGCGAHRGGQAKESLDYKLREALYVHDTVTGLLEELNGVLGNGMHIS